jgi:DNA-directed RNA polymerase subunit alpha
MDDNVAIEVITAEVLQWILGIQNIDSDMPDHLAKIFETFKAKKYTETEKILAGLYAKQTDELSYLAAWIAVLFITKPEKVPETLQLYTVKDESYYFCQGLLAEFDGNYADALNNYQKSIEEDEEFLPSIFRLAYYLNLRGEEEESLRLYERTLHISPLYVNVLINLGVLYEDMDDYHHAIECYQKILKKYPNHERAILYLKDAEVSLSMYVDEEKEREQDQQNQILGTPISDFELSVRSKNCLSKMKIRTLGDLTKKTEAELLAYKNFGETSLAEIKEILVKKGLKLGMGREEEEEALKKREKKTNKILKMADHCELSTWPVGNLELSVRGRKCLENLGIHTVGDLLKRSEKSLLGCKNFGNTSLQEIKQKLEEYGLNLKEDNSPNV